jgi:chromosome segregation ATPase
MTLLPVCRFTKEIDMAVLGSNNKSIKVNKSDLKKAIVSRNESLNKKNESLKSQTSELDKNIKQKESELQGLVASKQSDIESLKEQVKTYNSAKVKAYEESTQASNRLAELNSSVNSLSKKEKDLLSGIDELYLENMKQNKLLDLASNALQKAKDNKQELASQLKEDKLAISDAKEEYDSFMKSIEDKGHEANLRLDEKQSVVKDLSAEENKLNTKVKKLKSEDKAISSSIKGVEAQIKAKVDIAEENIKNSENNANKSLKEKYAELRKLNQTIERNQRMLLDVDNRLDNAKINLAKTKEQFNTFKVSALEGVAKMKLKGKLETIDKAGLKDILGE